MNENEFHNILWRSMIAVVKAYGVYRGYCKDIEIIK